MFYQFVLPYHLFGRAPHIYITDPDLIRLIFIKDFDHFQNKRMYDEGHELINDMMDILPCMQNYLYMHISLSLRPENF